TTLAPGDSFNLGRAGRRADSALRRLRRSATPVVVAGLSPDWGGCFGRQSSRGPRATVFDVRTQDSPRARWGSSASRIRSQPVPVPFRRTNGQRKWLEIAGSVP